MPVLRRLFGKPVWGLILIIALGGVLRFYGLNWGQGYFFHPDESQNVANAVVNLDFRRFDFDPDNLTYGSFPAYLIYLFSGPNYEQAILAGRALAAFWSTLLIPLVFGVTTLFLPGRQSRGWALLAALLTAFTPGLIQSAHFATYEAWLAFEYLLVLFFALRLAQNGRWHNYLGLSFALAMGLATKIVSLVLLPLLPLAHLLYFSRSRVSWLGSEGLKRLLVSAALTLAFAFLLAPYQVLRFSDFARTVGYEGSIARGTWAAFYTQQFRETLPVVYQLMRVFPYILGLPLLVLALGGMAYFTSRVMREVIGGPLKSWRMLLLLAGIFLYLGLQFSLFVKWTRYLVPALPMLIILGVVWLAHLKGEVMSGVGERHFSLQARRYGFGGVLLLLISWTIFQGLNFFSLYQQPDPRVQAASWARQNLPPRAEVLTESYDPGIMAFSTRLPTARIIPYNVYHLDDLGEDVSLEELYSLSRRSAYLIVLSQRIWVTRLRLCDEFPKGCQFYRDLENGGLGYREVARFSRRPRISLPWIYETPSLGKSLSLFLPDETFYVFDNPSVVIFKNTQGL